MKKIFPTDSSGRIYFAPRNKLYSLSPPVILRLDYERGEREGFS